MFLSVGLLLIPFSAAKACGPYFPNNLLGSGDPPLLAAPIADFRRELATFDLSPGAFDYVPPTNYDFAAQTLDAEVADLTTALRKAKIPDSEAVLTVVAYQKQRAQLNNFVREMEVWNNYHNTDYLDIYRSDTMPTNPPALPEFAPIPTLPAEFADYLAGAVAWRVTPPNVEAARQAWQRLLERPAAERKFKSTWAAFMLGKSWEDEDADKAVGYYRQTRALARRGFADSTGLALASIGWEARVELERQNFKAALTLYLDQYASGDNSAIESLRIVAARAMQASAEELTELAKTPRLRAVITAYLVSGGAGQGVYTTEQNPPPSPVAAWLAAVEAAEITDVECAERLALAAYQADEYDLAAGWVKRAKRSVVAQWVQAKLLLRQGQTPAAATVLARLARQLPPLSATETNLPEFVDRLTVETRRGRAQLQGEWGTLALSRGDFIEALDTLLRAGFWEDTAYVAERVLTTDELKSYVDQNWPATVSPDAPNPPPSDSASENTSDTTTTEMEDVFYDLPEHPDVSAEQIRHLLARRLTRESRGREAESYFPGAWQAAARPLLTELDAVDDAGASPAVRAQHLFTAAWIVRTNGLELLGTELAPDWFIHDGQFDCGLTWQDRATNNLEAQINIASEAELDRAARHRTDPEQRFHYRYQAALLGWEAAQLLPDNTDETARILCTAGTWLKMRDPDTADLFYKALVRRCRKTAIGAQADVMRWFPVLDESGNPKPYPPRPATLDVMAEAPDEITLIVPTDTIPTPPPLEPFYIVHAGDTLSRIAQLASAPEHPVTMQMLLELNPGLDAARLKIGQKIILPTPEETAEPPPALPLP